MKPSRIAVVGVVAVGVVAVGVVAAAAARSARKVPSVAGVLEAHKDKVSYGMGVELARSISRLGVEVDPEVVLQGVRDALGGKDLLMTEDDLRATVIAVRGEVAQKRAGAAKTAAEARKTQGEAFLAENAKKDGVVTLPSGLQYKVIEKGDGETPTGSDTIECHYRGTLVDGTEFDSSRARGGPATFQVKRVIAGWREALMLMPVGSKWQLYVPPELAYGRRGAGRKIGPDATLVFDVELLAIKNPDAKETKVTAPGDKPSSARAPSHARTSTRTAAARVPRALHAP